MCSRATPGLSGCCFFVILLLNLSCDVNTVTTNKYIYVVAAVQAYVNSDTYVNSASLLQVIIRLFLQRLNVKSHLRNKYKHVYDYIRVQTTSFSGYECVDCTAECQECTSSKTQLNSVLSMYRYYALNRLLWFMSLM